MTPSRLVVPALCALAVALASAGLVPLVRNTPPDLQAADIAFVHPDRRAPETSPAAPPELPPGAGDVTPVTMEILIERTPGNGTEPPGRQTVSRTRDRIHTSMEAREWLFERNAVDPRRVSAQLVDHASRSIVQHEESDLRHTLGVSGWADVLMLGLDAPTLARLAPTGESRVLDGIRFDRHASGAAMGVSDVWWSQPHLLPMAFMTRDAAGSTTVSVRRVRRGVDPALLQPPSMRYRDYNVVDLAEWLEGH